MRTSGTICSVLCWPTVCISTRMRSALARSSRCMSRFLAVRVS
ncbi:hypothetical protein [Rugamonas sp. DEMB1]|nr:hypothetical protein [Rugamonas sp. DEMB1]WGG53095.1 hypothetical protein QC826_13860 [Rugamonas sp. DEMB1]